MHVVSSSEDLATLGKNNTVQPGMDPDKVSTAAGNPLSTSTPPSEDISLVPGLPTHSCTHFLQPCSQSLS